MHLECLLCLAFISFDKSEWQGAEEFFNQAYFVSNKDKLIYLSLTHLRLILGGERD